MHYSVSISKQELSNLPVEKFDGKIIVVSSAETAAKAIQNLKKAKTVGFDTETRPSFKKGLIYKVALVQLSDGEKTYLFRLSKMGLPDVMKEFLEDENVIKIGLSIKDDFLSLSRFSKISPRGFIDLQQYVKEFDIKDNSLSKIYGVVFGKRISKGQQLSNWEASTLSDNQKKYAALDAKACLDIYNALNTGKFNPAESPYYKLEDEEA